MRKIKTRTNLYRPPESWPMPAQHLYRAYEACLWRELTRPRTHLVLLRPFFHFQVRQGLAFNEVPRPALDLYLKPLNGWRREDFLVALSRWLRFLDGMGQPLVPELPELPGGPVHRLRRVELHMQLVPPKSWPERALELFRRYRERLQQRQTKPRVYLRLLIHFFREQKKQGFTFRDYPPALLEGYFASRRPFTVRMTVSALASWLRFLYARKELLLPLHESLSKYRRRLRSPKPILSHAQVLQVLALASGDDPESLRDRAFLEMGYACAMRPGELLALNLNDVDLKTGLVQVMKSKNYRQRRLPLTQIALNALKRYLAEGRPELLSPLSLNTLWLNQQGARLNHNQITVRLDKVYRRKERLDFHFHLHLLRHACATHLLAGGAPLRHVQELLGHVCLGSTQIYTHLLPRRLAEEHRRCHPRFSPGFSTVSG